MSNVIEVIDKGDKVIEIHQDEDAQNPRSPDFEDHDDVMVCFHNRYNLGDEKHGYRHDNFNSWDELKKAIERDNDIAEILPVYMLDHSGITISVNSFNDIWDSGQIGFIFITKQEARKSHMVKKLSKKVMKTVHSNLLASIEEYDKYLTGDVYFYNIKNKTGEIIDSCGGYYGLEYAIKEAEEACS